MIRPLVAAAFALAACAAHAQVTFTVDFDASANVLTTAERDAVAAHLRDAGRRWAQALGITAARAIELRVAVSNVPTANGTSNTSAAIGTIAGRTTYEQGVAYELRTGTDPNGAAPDGTVTFGLTYLRNELWFDPSPETRTAPVPIDRTDAMSVALHELGHILAYNGWADLTTGVSPATYWSTFDRWMQPGAPSTITGPYSVAAWGYAPDVTTGNNKHWGNAMRLADARPGRALAPVEWAYGAPVPQATCELPASVDAPPSFVRDALVPDATLIDELMNGVVFYRGTRYDIGALDRALMSDVGLMVDAIFGNGFQ
ncbi:MAG TPA: hypothetical protein VJ724_02255 [Tahibacter sp.]|nr:hypothetical protein [Tahibacter sp.]